MRRVQRERLPWLKPQPLGLSLSAGCGDRLGLATPGHIRALRAVGGIAPVLAQQSIRENARTGRTPQQVLADATWGVFQEGWRDPWGAMQIIEECGGCGTVCRSGVYLLHAGPGRSCR